MTARVLLAAAIHEGGHCLALWLQGARITGFCLTSFGAELTTENGKLSYGEEVLAVLAGPAANLGCAWITAEDEIFTGINVVLAVYNLLPVRQLDGGRACELLVTWLLGPAAGERAIRTISGVTSALLSALLGYVMWRTGGSLWLLPPAVVLAMTAWRELLGKT